jgi:voltage-gated potassium channel
VKPARARVVLRTTAAALGVVAVGTVGYMLIEGMNLLDAIYMTAITVTTIGFREVVPLSHSGQIFTIVMAFLGVGVILLVATELGHTVVEGDLRRIIGLRRDAGMIRKLKDHIVVAGSGRMGRAVVEVLTERRVPFVVIESNPDRVRELEEDRVPVVLGDATQESAQRAANVPAARTFLACLADDAHNVFAILLARQLKGDLAIIARAVEEGSEERLHLAGADKVINPYRLGGMRLAFTALKPTVMDFIEASLGGPDMELELTEIVVRATSELVGKTLAGADVRRRFGLIVVALKRKDHATFNPGPDTTIEAGDVLVTLGPVQAVDQLEKAST